VVAEVEDLPSQLHAWIEAVNNSTEILFEKTTKSGKIKEVNLRDRLFSLTLESNPPQPPLEEGGAKETKLRYIGSCQNDGTVLRPEHLIYMLEQVSGQNIELVHAHRERLILS
jgi:uncharacterized protein (DUF2344 family)